MSSDKKPRLVPFPNQQNFTKNSVEELVMNHRYFSKLTNTSYSDIFDPSSPLLKGKGAVPKQSDSINYPEFSKFDPTNGEKENNFYKILTDYVDLLIMKFLYPETMEEGRVDYKEFAKLGVFKIYVDEKKLNKYSLCLILPPMYTDLKKKVQQLLKKIQKVYQDAKRTNFPTFNVYEYSIKNKINDDIVTFLKNSSSSKNIPDDLRNYAEELDSTIPKPASSSTKPEDYTPLMKLWYEVSDYKLFYIDTEKSNKDTLFIENLVFEAVRGIAAQKGARFSVAKKSVKEANKKIREHIYAEFGEKRLFPALYVQALVTADSLIKMKSTYQDKGAYKPLENVLRSKEEKDYMKKITECSQGYCALQIPKDVDDPDSEEKIYEIPQGPILNKTGVIDVTVSDIDFKVTTAEEMRGILKNRYGYQGKVDELAPDQLEQLINKYIADQKKSASITLSS